MRFFLALIMLLLIAVPPFLGLGLQFALISALVASLFAAAFNLLMGQGGMLSFGHAAYYGLGAFATLHLMRATEAGLAFPTVLLPVAGAVAGLLAGLAFGYFATQRAGAYFSLVTLALAELLHVLAPQWAEVFGGEAGVSSMRMPFWGLTFGSTLEVYYLVLAWTAISIALLYAYTRTPFGRLTLALRDNEQRVRFMGYNAHATKVLVFAISAMFSGIAGSLLVVATETINYTIFGMHSSAQVVLHTFVGGSTIFLGPVLGAILLTLFATVASEATRAWLLYQGIIFVLVILYAPRGIAGVIESHIAHHHTLPGRQLLRPYVTAAMGAVLVGFATVFIVQTAEHLFSEQYRAKVASAGELVTFAFLGVNWSPANPLTWLLPVVLFVAGILILRGAAKRIHQLWSKEKEEEFLDLQPEPAVALGESAR
jgi:branched-chain amino acid transport system permease protein